MSYFSCIRSNHCIVHIPGTEVTFLSGGFLNTNVGGAYNTLYTAYTYDWSAGVWTQEQNTPVSSYTCTAILDPVTGLASRIVVTGKTILLLVFKPNPIFKYFMINDMYSLQVM
jgi:hypothetical protein